MRASPTLAELRRRLELVAIINPSWNAILKIRGVEGFRKELAHAQDFDFAFEIGEHDRNVATKFPDDLAAVAAGRGERVGVGDDGDGIETALAFADGFEDGDALGAESEAVSGVFDVAAGENLARRRVQGSADFEIGKFGVSVFADLGCRGDEGVMFGHCTSGKFE